MLTARHSRRQAAEQPRRGGAISRGVNAGSKSASARRTDGGLGSASPCFSLKLPSRVFTFYRGTSGQSLRVNEPRATGALKVMMDPSSGLTSTSPTRTDHLPSPSLRGWEQQVTWVSFPCFWGFHSKSLKVRHQRSSPALWLPHCGRGMPHSLAEPQFPNCKRGRKTSPCLLV